MTDWFGHLGKIFEAYSDMFFPDDEEITSGIHQTDEWRLPRTVAMPAFLHYFTSNRILMDVDQMQQWACGVFVPFDKVFGSQWGMSATDMLAMADWLSTHLQGVMDSLTEATYQLGVLQDDQTRAVQEQALTKEQADAWLRNDARSQHIRTYRQLIDQIGEVERNELSAAFGAVKAQAFWDRFVARRGSVRPQDYTYITDPNPFEQRPLVETAPGKAVLFLSNHLYAALNLQMNALLKGSDDDITKSYLKRRDKYLEKRVADLLKDFFGAEAQVLTSVFQRPDSQNENDILVLWRGWAFIVECKASERSDVFRDPERAYKRIKQEFKAVVQKAAEQGAQLRRLITKAQEEGKPLPLYDEDGQLLHTIQPGDIVAVDHCCLTSDHFGYLNVDPTWLLDCGAAVPCPWCINLYELEHFIEGLKLRGWGPDRLHEYVMQRVRLFGKVQTADELEVAGVFITLGSLDNLLYAPGSMTFTQPNLAQVFIDIHLYRLGALDHVDFDSYPTPVHHDVGAMREARMLHARHNRTLREVRDHERG